ncbi:hypothetical protein [Desulfogranum marinum]|uniref:hypothetical protein n=1 Tax=Desulfogranum marinum TaxID=453220 RepID=UPI0029C82654|nr:hypothetical protein [Desulfogranum marinum]
MEKIEYWRLNDEFTVVQAALLIIGVDPDEYEDVLSLEQRHRPAGFNAVLTALTADIEQGDFEGTFVLMPKDVINHADGVTITQCMNPRTSKIHVSSIKKWLKIKNLSSEIFLSNANNQPDYLNTEHPHYSPKLAAAIYAWESVSSDASLLRGKTVKQALTDWLEENAARFGLLKGDREINKQGVEETAKIANWVTKGGVPKTPF